MLTLRVNRRELDKKKAGGPGTFILDDDRKYPGKESLGPLSEPNSVSAPDSAITLRPLGPAMAGTAAGRYGLRVSHLRLSV